VPFTPYHFGPSGFVGLVLRKQLDIPVLVLANVIADMEVLFFHKWPVHRYFHTLLIGAAVGALWGLIAYPARPAFKWVMKLLHIPYQPSLLKMVISGILGVWLHVLLDSIYHWDVNAFWPYKSKPLFHLVSQEHLKLICIGLLFAAITLYAFAVKSYIKQNKV
jgi:membrane-bound metal-dependent hydrolase YbcI (DUF457 family)